MWYDFSVGQDVSWIFVFIIQNIWLTYIRTFNPIQTKYTINHSCTQFQAWRTLGGSFPLISQIVLNNVDDKSLTNFRKTSRENSNFLENERFYWIRRIKRYFSNFEEFQESWKKVIKKTPVDFLKDLAIDVHSFFQGLIK